MSTSLRFTGFHDSLGQPISEGDYVLINMDDYTQDIKESREIIPLIEKLKVQYFQLYIVPTSTLSYTLMIHLVDKDLKLITTLDYYFAKEADDSDYDSFVKDFSKGMSEADLIEPHDIGTLCSYAMLKWWSVDNVWIKIKKPLVNIDKFIPVLPTVASNSLFIQQGNNLLFTIPDAIYGNYNDRFYNSNLGKEMKLRNVRYLQLYIQNTPYLSAHTLSCYLDDNKKPLTLADEVKLGVLKPAHFQEMGYDINNCDHSQPYIEKTTDSFMFLTYLQAKGGLLIEENPTFNLSVF